MPDEAVSLRDINWRETFPFTHLFRAFRIAIHPSKLILALVAIGCLWCGGLVGDAIWVRHYTVVQNEQYDEGPHSTMTPSLVEYEKVPSEERQRLAREEPQAFHGIFRTFWDYEVTQANKVLMFNWQANPFESIWSFVAVGPLWFWSYHWLYALLYTIWFLLVWSVFGGAISRIAAVHVGRDEKISVRHALSFSISKVLSFVFAPVIPVFIVLAIGVAIACAGTALLHIPWAGPIIVGLFFVLALLGGFIMTLVILGTIGGFNLMYPTVAVEGSDSFDAISRSFSYVFARPWRMLWYTVVAVVYGAICYLFVRFFVWIMLATTWFFMNWFLGGSPAKYWPVIWPAPHDPLASLPYSPDYLHLKGTEAVAAGLITWWVYLVIGLIGAFAISFYFSANTIIYYLMRREVDATELDDVYVEETEDELEEPAAAAGAAGATASETATVRVYETPQAAAPESSNSGPTADAATPPTEPPPA